MRLRVLRRKVERQQRLIKTAAKLCSSRYPGACVKAHLANLLIRVDRNEVRLAEAHRKPRTQRDQKARAKKDVRFNPFVELRRIIAGPANTNLRS